VGVSGCQRRGDLVGRHCGLRCRQSLRKSRAASPTRPKVTCSLCAGNIPRFKATHVLSESITCYSNGYTNLSEASARPIRLDATPSANKFTGRPSLLGAFCSLISCSSTAPFAEQTVPGALHLADQQPHRPGEIVVVRISGSHDGRRAIGGFSKFKRAFDKAMPAELHNTHSRAKLPNWTVHDLRRTARSLMSRAAPRARRIFYRPMEQMRTSHPDEGQLVFLAFDLLHQDGVDLRGLPLSKRKHDLPRLCSKSRVLFLKQVQSFPDGAVLLEYCNKFGFEGVVSKRLSLRYVSGPSRHWSKIEVPELDARQCRALPSVRDAKETGANRARTRTGEETARVCSRA
jgi:ATP dependent DNA ligase domain